MRNQPPRRVEVEPGKFGPVSGTLCGLVAALITALLGDTVDGFEWWYPLPFAVAVTAAVWWARRRRKIRAITAWFASACVIVPSVWAAVTIARGWSLLGVIVLLACAVFAGVFAALFKEKPEDVAAVVAAEQAEQQEAHRDPQELELEELVREFLKSKKPPTVTKVKEWPLETGNTWLLEGQRGSGFNYRWLTEFQVELAAAMRLPLGCPINAEPAKTHQGAALLHVSRVNDMHLDIPFSAEYSPRSIRDSFSIGQFLDKTDTLVNLFQDTTLVNGQKGSGKSVLLQVMTANSLFCHDSLTGIVDLNGGRMISPWMMLYAMGLIERPPLAFAAPTARTAKELAAYLAELAKERSARYQRMMNLHDVDVLPVGNGRDMCMTCRKIHPTALQIFVDEAGEMMGDDASAEALEAATAFREIVRIARAMAINITFSTQRGTSDYVPAQVKKAISQMISLRVGGEEELSWLFGWSKGLSPDDLADHPGKGYIQYRGGAVRMFKARRLMPAQIGQISKYVSSQPEPELEQTALDLGGDWLSRRWQHPDLVTFLSRLRDDDTDPAPASGGGQPSFLTRESIAVSPLGQALRSVPAATAEVEEVGFDGEAGVSWRDERIKQVRDMDEDSMEAEFAGLVGLFEPEADQTAVEEGSPAGEEVDKSSKAARHEFIVKTVIAAGEDGIKTGDIVALAIEAGLARKERPQTVKEDLPKLVDAGRIARKTDFSGRDVTGWWIGPGYAAR